MPSKTFGILAVWIITCAMALASCSGGNSTAANEYYHIDDGIWDSQDTALFRIDSSRADGDYVLDIALRTTHDVQFQKLYLVAEQRYEKPALYSKDTVCVQLTDTMGKMLGSGLRLNNYSVIAKGNMHLRKGQNGQIKVYHIMRRTQTSGITDIGINLHDENSSN